ncbi:hypothetical protein [Aureimonas pseudogalii]|uniref:Uncharacterized protein n=1 Tax=Aureimonas pseudogalii TaxID=1744844 RepID=A0A7W6EER1_9HYPH|nr:hypothetical protein [Aureimonas pseudogalii]MBB3996883.1 hypothetical protein [Aureimonas pseudogalii]
MPIRGAHGDVRAEVSAAVDRAFAEPVEIAFLTKGRADPAKPPSSIMAVLRTGGGEEGNLTGGTAQDWRTRIASGKAELHIDLAAYPATGVRLGDRIRAVSRRGKPWFEILRIDDRGDTRLVLILGEV